MSRRRPPWKHDWSGPPPEWWRQGDEWWAAPGQGREAWSRFGRTMAVKALVLVAMFAIVMIALGALVSVVFSAVKLATGILVVLLTPIVFALLVYVLVQLGARSWRPIRDLMRAAGELADGDYSVRVDVSGSPATRRAVQSFNDMAGRLESSDRQRRQLLADLGHELRTPLTVLRAEIEAMLDGVHTLDRDNLEPLMGEVAVMERLLEDLRTLSLLEAGALQLHPEPTDLAVLVADVADSYRRRAAEAGVNIRVEAEPVELVLDPVRVREVITNLVNNSIRAMPEGGELLVTTRPQDRGAVLEVSDTGIGIAEEDLDRVFERFQKGATSSGSGLGLTISRNLVRAHGGRISIDSKADQGTTVTIDLSDIRPGTATHDVTETEPRRPL